MSGLAVLQKLKSEEQTKSIPVVVITSFYEDQDIKRCHELGADS